MKRGQTSLEVMVFIGIVIVLSVLIVTQLYEIPEIGVNLEQSNLDLYWETTAEIGIVGGIFNGTDGNLALKNNLNDFVKVKIIRLDDEVVYNSSLGLAPLETDLAIFPFEYNNTDFSLDVEITYENIETGGINTFIGEVNLRGEILDLDVQEVPEPAVYIVEGSSPNETTNLTGAIGGGPIKKLSQEMLHMCIGGTRTEF